MKRTINDFIGFFKRIMPYSLKMAILKIYNWFASLSWFVSIYEFYLIKGINKKHNNALAEVRKKKKVTVAFFVIHGGIWKYDVLYKLLNDDTNFHPIIIICPYVSFGVDNMNAEMDAAYQLFIQKGYRVLKSFNDSTLEWLDIKKEIKPDIVFFTNPHAITKKQYYIRYWQSTLTCYVQYSFHVSHLNSSQYNQLFHNLIWKAFYETPMHLKFAKEHTRNKGKNVLITGYPGTDVFLDKSYKFKDVWKIKDAQIKRIIWAPHHTIENESELGYSNFLNYAEFMLSVLDIYSDSVQIAFKPHPILKPKLYEHPDWGHKRTNLYYETWCNKKNAMLMENEYIDLFLGSDGIIHDSGSFLVEYLYVNKPALFCLKDDKVQEKFNEFGKLALDVHFIAKTKADIIDFINNILLEKDSLVSYRENFIKEYLIPPNNTSASQNIFNELSKMIKY